MRKKIEEQLAKLAFGDLDADEAMNLELRAKDDPEAARTLETYCRMKEELRSLSLDVPADQLSKERLREAILTRGLERQKAASSKPTWLWMPAAAAALAFGIVFVKGYQPAGKAGSTMVVDNATLGKPEMAMPNVVIPLKVDKAAIDRVVKSAVVQTQRPLYVMNERPRRSERTDGYVDRHDRVAVPGLPSGTFTGPDGPRASVAEGGLAPKDLTQTPVFDSSRREIEEKLSFKKDSSSQPVIVVIQPETDQDTGTLKAKEIENTANVVIGG